jgi:hypothetical protein
MIDPLHWTTVLGSDAESGASANSAAIDAPGFGPVASNRGNRSGLVGKRMYRLTEIAPTA